MKCDSISHLELVARTRPRPLLHRQQDIQTVILATHHVVNWMTSLMKSHLEDTSTLNPHPWLTTILFNFPKPIHRIQMAMFLLRQFKLLIRRLHSVPAHTTSSPLPVAQSSVLLTTIISPLTLLHRPNPSTAHTTHHPACVNPHHPLQQVSTTTSMTRIQTPATTSNISLA